MATLLYNNSSYNLLNSLNTPERLVTTAKQLGYDTIAICDEGIMNGAVEFFDLCQQQGMKPLIGLSLNLVGKVLMHCLLFAKNDNGYQHLMQLSSIQQLNGEVQLAQVKPDNLVMIMIFDNLPWSQWLQDYDHFQLTNELETVKQTYPDIMFAIFNNDLKYHQMLNQQILGLGEELKVPCIAIHQSFYPNADDDRNHLVLQAIKLQVNQTNKQLVNYPNRHLLTQEELTQWYPRVTIANTDRMAELCNITMALPKATLPRYQHESNVEPKALLRALCTAGLNKRMQGKIPVAYQQRLNMELETIIKMGYEDYFLIVYDFILYANKQGIATGPGRGSAAGSLVAYCLGITHVDPMQFDLLFERFLNPERVSLPDIDSDIADDGREQVIKYIFSKFNNFRSAHIITFGTFKAKQALRDVAKVFSLNSYEIDSIAKAVPDDLNVTLSSAYQNTPAFRNLINSNETYVLVYKTALRIENLPRHISTHAAGIVLSDIPLEHYVPVMRIGEAIMTQYPMNYLERFGLIKMDILGLRNLSIIEEVATAAGINNQLRNLPLDDPATFKLLNNNLTLGIFQLESGGMRNLLSKLKPEKFDDIVAVLALFRPGPMDNINAYLSNRSQPAQINYLNPAVKQILSPTYGIMIYQEQVMQIAQIAAGFSLAKADILRKAISKKKDSEIQALKADFIAGCIANRMRTEQAEELFAFIEKFANYGFNKSHSVAYAIIAYQCAYLKAHYPDKFYCALLNSVIGNDTKTNEYVVEGRRQGVNFLPPSVQYSYKKFTCTEQGIRFPLSAIKGFGMVSVNEYLLQRENFGPYSDLVDFVVRNYRKGISTKSWELLIKAGALDDFKLSRNSMLQSLPVCLKYAELVKTEVNGQSSFELDVIKKPEMVIQKDDQAVNITHEMELLGVYFGKHPVTQLIEQYKLPVRELKTLAEGQTTDVAVMISKIKQHRTKQGDLMLFLQVEDAGGQYDFVAMPPVYQRFTQQLQNGVLLYCQVMKDKRGSFLIKNVLKY